jgi:hypothetical protein
MRLKKIKETEDEEEEDEEDEEHEEQGEEKSCFRRRFAEGLVIFLCFFTVLFFTINVPPPPGQTWYDAESVHPLIKNSIHNNHSESLPRSHNHTHTHTHTHHTHNW